MLKKNINTIIVGENYISFLLAFQLLSENRDVLILNDERLNSYNSHFCHFGMLEKEYVNSWGEDLGVSALENIQDYIEVSPFILSLDNTEIFLGRRNSFDNLRELSRKVPSIFLGIYNYLMAQEVSDQDFNKSFEQLSFRLGKNISRYKNLQNINLQTFSSHCPDFFNIAFEKFYEAINGQLQNNEDNELVALFVYAARGIYQNVLTVKLSKIEAMHLFISLLGVRYKLELNGLVNDLKNDLVYRGGNYRACPIREWKFYKSRPWCVELNSFEGIVHPKNIAFIGGKPERFPLEFTSKTIVGNFKVTISKSEREFLLADTYRFKKALMGSQFPFWIESINDTNKEIMVFSKILNCHKAAFYEEEIKALFLSEKIIRDEDEILSIEMGTEVFAHSVASSLNFPKKMAISDTSDVLQERGLKDVHYIGPCQRAPLGLLSSLMESKDYRSFL